MKKRLLNLEGAQELTKGEQKAIKGGTDPVPSHCGFGVTVNSNGLCFINGIAGTAQYFNGLEYCCENLLEPCPSGPRC